MKLGICLAALLLFLGTPPLAQSHGGGLNKCGCHMDTKTNTCHCHQPPYGGCGPECYARPRQAGNAAEQLTPAMMGETQETDCEGYRGEAEQQLSKVPSSNVHRPQSRPIPLSRP